MEGKNKIRAKKNELSSSSKPKRKSSKKKELTLQEQLTQEHQHQVVESEEVPSTKKKCTMCGLTKRFSEYYNSSSVLNRANGTLSICKDCVGELYNEYFRIYDSYKKAIYYLCRKIDLPFSVSAYNGAEALAKKNSGIIWQVYIRQINSFKDINNYGSCFDSSDEWLDENSKKITETVIYNFDDEDFELTSDLIHKWGKVNKTDIIYLEKEYQDWCTRYEVSTKSMEEIIKNICYIQMIINKKKERNENINNELKSLQDLMNSGALKPVQESAAMGTEASTLGTLIKKFENERPISEPSAEFKDVDKIGKFIRTFFLGHFCRFNNVPNPYEKEYQEEMDKYTIDVDLEGKEVVPNDLE